MLFEVLIFEFNWVLKAPDRVLKTPNSITSLLDRGWSLQLDIYISSRTSSFYNKPWTRSWQTLPRSKKFSTSAIIRCIKGSIASHYFSTGSEIEFFYHSVMNGIFFSRRLTQVIFIEHRLFLWNTTKAYLTISIHYYIMYRRAAPKEIFDSAVRRNFPGKFKTFGSELTK